jgi:polysaccharide biosynthesis/export protein
VVNELTPCSKAAQLLDAAALLTMIGLTLRCVFFAPLIMSVCLAGCASQPLGGSPNLRTVSPNGALPPPSRADLATITRPYLIGAFDQLTISVFGIEEMTNIQVQTDASGKIAFPLVGVVEAVGKTPGELSSEIASGLRGRYIRNPQVTVNLKETVSQIVTVDGEVTEPGLYPVVAGMTLMRAVATAKGATDYAKLGHVAIFRTVEGQRMAALYDLKAIRDGKYEDPQIYANDVVVVGDNPTRRLLKDVLQALPSLTGPLVYVLARN